jgi:hypothetical protein
MLLQGNVALDAASMACLWMMQIFKRSGAVGGVSVTLPESLSTLISTSNARQFLTEVTHIALLPMHDLKTVEKIITGLNWTSQAEGKHPELQALLRTGECHL